MGLLGVCEYFGRLIHGILPQYRLHYPPLSELGNMSHCLKRLKYTDFSSRFGVQRSCLKKHQFIAVSWLQIANSARASVLLLVLTSFNKTKFIIVRCFSLLRTKTLISY